MLQRGETTFGPVAVGGRTITLVAKTRVFRFGTGERGALHVRARPAHVEVLDESGRREVVHIRDVEGMLMSAIVLAGASYVIGVRALRRARSA
jgi:hypothetical protein